MSLQSTRVLTGSAVTFSDGLGDRVPAIDADGCPLEVLRIRPEYLDAPGFEPALHERTARLGAFRDAAIAHVRRIEHDGRLAIVSERIEGRRLSVLLAEVAAGRLELRFDSATVLIRQLVTAVSRLHAYGRDVAHGALAPERIVVTDSGELVIVEPVLGPAMEQLQWSRRRLWLSGRVAMPQAVGICRFDQRADLAQVGATALAILLGRPLRDEEYPDGLTLALREASDRVARAAPTLAPGVAGWLLRALQIEGRSFTSAKDTLAALDDLLAPSAADVQPAVAGPAPSRPASQPAAERAASPPEPRTAPVPAPAAPEAPVTPVARRPVTPAPAGAHRINVKVDLRERLRSSSMLMARAAVAVVMIAGAAAGTARYCYQAAASTETRIREAPPPIPAAPRVPRVRAKPAVTTPQTVEPEITAEALVLPGQVTAVPESGWMVINAPVDVTIYEGGRRLGEVREGRLSAVPGTHEIEIINETLGFRETRRVEVHPGQDAIVPVNLPFGAVDLNATPWAEVWLDGTRLGETPIGSLSLPIGPHEFIFRHPEFGERRYAISLTAAEPVRLTVDMTRR
jgi:hypothetical protein